MPLFYILTKKEGNKRNVQIQKNDKHINRKGGKKNRKRFLQQK